MKPLNWNTTAEDAAYMRMRQIQNLATSSRNPNEQWVARRLEELGLKFNRQTIWGRRLFDFWNPVLGIAIEVDGKDHDADYDAYRDEYNFRRSGIVVLRLPNRDELTLERICAFVRCADNLAIRKQKLGIAGDSKAAKRSLAVLPYPPSLLNQFVAENTNRVEWNSREVNVEKFGH